MFTEDSFVVDRLREHAALHESRNAEYGDSYMVSGEFFYALVRGEAVTVQSVEEWSRLVNFVLTAGKLHRYGANFANGGHDDSLADLAVYATMQLRLDTERRLQAEACRAFVVPTPYAPPPLRADYIPDPPAPPPARDTDDEIPF